MESVWKFLDLNETITVGLALVVLGAVYASQFWAFPITEQEWDKLTPRGYRKRGRMLRKHREKIVINVAMADFVDVIEKRVMNGDYTRKESSEIYRRLKRGFPRVKDIFPAPHLLKENIKKRLASKDHEPVPLPDRKPKYKRKHAFDYGPERVVL